MNTLSVASFANIFSHSMGCLFFGLFRCKQGFPVQNLLSLCMYVCMYSFVCLFIIFNSLILDYNVFFPIIAVFQDSVNFLLYGKVAQSHLHIYLFSHIILHHKLSRHSSQGYIEFYYIYSCSANITT